MTPRPLVLLLPVLGLGCVDPAAPPARAPSPALGVVREGTPTSVNIAVARGRGEQRAFAWRTWSPETFAEARRDHKFILLDGAAEWCHWCHVMDETTYMDAEIGRILRERFVAIKVDIDERPDLAERYGAWGWPATILFSPDAEELGKHRGYLPPEELRDILHQIESASAGATQAGQKPEPTDVVPPIEALAFIAGRTLLDFDSYYDDEEGGWGKRQKAPLGAHLEVEMVRALHGDAEAPKRALFTIGKQRALIDPVWGGVYQYSAASTWDKPHYEKLMTYQAANLEAYARVYARTHDAGTLADAQRIALYLSTFLSNADGAFLVTQDADVNAHDAKAPFIDGDVYYRKDDAGRRALGVPRVDDHVYGHENGLAIAAFAALYEATRDPAALARGKRAADLLLRTAVGPDGSVRRGTSSVRYLADAASLGRSLARLAEVSGEAAYKDAALSVAAAMRRDLEDPATGAFWAHTPDGSAAGVFARREKPFVQNVLAARLFAALWRVTGDTAWKDRGRRTVAAISTPRALGERGRMIGDYLLALDEVGAIAWP